MSKPHKPRIYGQYGVWYAVTSYYDEGCYAWGESVTECLTWRDALRHVAKREYGVDLPELRWHYGPTDKDPDPGRVWCDDCGGEVYFFKEGGICSGCGQQGED